MGSIKINIFVFFAFMAFLVLRMDAQSTDIPDGPGGGSGTAGTSNVLLDCSGCVVKCDIYSNGGAVCSAEGSVTAGGDACTSQQAQESIKQLATLDAVCSGQLKCIVLSVKAGQSCCATVSEGKEAMRVINIESLGQGSKMTVVYGAMSVPIGSCQDMTSKLEPGVCTRACVAGLPRPERLRLRPIKDEPVLDQPDSKLKPQQVGRNRRSQQP
jgi:hypothetical protein